MSKKQRITKREPTKESWHKLKTVGRVLNQYIIISIWVKTVILMVRLFKKDKTKRKKDS